MRVTARWRAVLAGLALLGGVGCETGVEPGPPLPPPADGQLGLVREVSWPGGGRELTVRLHTVDGMPMSGDLSATLALLDDGTEEPLARAARPHPLPPGFTAVVVRPSDSAAGRDALVEALREFAAARPDGERIALFRWGPAVDQVVGFTADRARLDRGIERFGELAPEGAPEAAQAAMLGVERVLFDVEGAAPDVMRAIVALGEDDPREATGSTALPVLYADAAPATASGGMLDASSLIDEFAATSYYTLAFCAPQGAVAHVVADGLNGELPVLVGGALPEERDAACDPEAIPGERAYPSTIELVFDDAQRAVYQDRVAAKSKADFELSVRLWPEAAPISATAHLRGKGTIDCERKSYTLELKGPDRALMPGSSTDEVYLISMCADDRYIEQFTANQLMHELGIFPWEFRYVELVLDGETRGVYLLLEKAKEQLVGDNSLVGRVLRRSFPRPDDSVEVEFARDDDDAAAKAAYEALMADLAAESGEELAAVAEERLDLEAYLRLVAIMSAYQNGDWVDEVWLTGSDAVVRGGGRVDWFAPAGWDNDDLFSTCHYSGQYAFVDAPGLTYCAESRLDHMLLGDAVTYDRYVDVLEELLDGPLSPARFAAAAERTEAALLPWFEREDIAAAMIELVDDNPDAIDPAEARRDIAEQVDALEASYADRHALLVQRIAAYREQP